MSSGCYVGVAGTGQGVEADPLTKIVKSPMLNPSNPPRQIEHGTREHRDACALCLTHGYFSAYPSLLFSFFFCFTLFSCRFRAVD